MTVHQPPEQFTANGNVRVADVLNSAGKQIDRILDGDGQCEPRGGRVNIDMSREAQLRRLAIQLRDLAESIEKGK